jgi:hypothetical protein
LAIFASTEFRCNPALAACLLRHEGKIMRDAFDVAIQIP